MSDQNGKLLCGHVGRKSPPCRGVCNSCASNFSFSVREGLTTWEHLEATGKVLPRIRKRRTVELTKDIFAADLAACENDLEKMKELGYLIRKAIKKNVSTDQKPPGETP